MLNYLHGMLNGFADRSNKILLYNAWAQFRDYHISYIIPNRQFADGHSIWRAEEVNQPVHTLLASM